MRGATAKRLRKIAQTQTVGRPATATKRLYRTLKRQYKRMRRG